MGFIKNIFRIMPKEQKEYNNKDYTYEEGKMFEITGAAYFRQVFSFGKIEYRYRKDNKMYLILPLHIHYCDSHDDGGWTDWQGIDKNNESTIVFDEYGEWLLDDLRYVAFEIPKDQNHCIVNRYWGMYAGWKEDGEDNYCYIPIMIRFDLTELLSLPVVDGETLRDGYLIINNELHRYNDLMKNHDNNHYLSLLNNKYNNIEIIKKMRFL